MKTLEVGVSHVASCHTALVNGYVVEAHVPVGASPSPRPACSKNSQGMGRDGKKERWPFTPFRKMGKNLICYRSSKPHDHPYLDQTRYGQSGRSKRKEVCEKENGILETSRFINQPSGENQMTLKTTLLAATLAAFAASAAYANEEHHADAKAEKAEAVKEKAPEAKTPVKKHSHAAEKGAPATESKAGKSHRETMDKDMPMHDHTQDRH